MSTPNPNPLPLPLQIVLVEPEIPPNTGNIARLCGATCTILHLVKPLGFSIDDRQLKRAGLDYWDAVDIRIWESFAELQAATPNGRWWYTSKKAARSYIAADYQPGDLIVFGKETKGLPAELLAAQADHAIRIPIFSQRVRSLNLSTSAGIVLYEALRQCGRLE